MVAEHVVAHFKKVGVDLPKIKQSIDENGVLRFHNKKDLEAMIDFIINKLTYVDNSILLFNERKSLILGIRITYEVMVKWVLTIHIGHNGKMSNTALMHAPSTRGIS